MLRLAILLVPLVGGLVYASTLPQTFEPAPASYADQRVVGGIPNVGDVLSNELFLVVGLWGLLFVATRATSACGDRAVDAAFFAGVVLTGLGSTWYHLAPSATRLFWDRFGMTIAMLSFLAIVVGERIGQRAGRLLIAPLVAAGLASLIYGRATGDVRWYLVLVQGYPLCAVPILLLLWPSRLSAGGQFWIVLAWSLASKICEIWDREILQATRCVSGHSLRHVFAAVAAGWVIVILSRRERLSLGSAWLRFAGGSRVEGDP